MKKLILLLVLTSCSTYVRTPATKMMSPESQGGLGHGQLEIRAESQKKDEIDFSNGETNNSIDRENTTLAPSPMGEVGIFNILDIYLNGHVRSPSILGAKLQVLGKGKKEADKGNFSLSLIYGFGGSTRESSTQSDLDDIFDGAVESVELRQEHEEMGFITGYRWSKNFLHYVNYIYQQDHVHGKVTTTNGSLTDAAFDYWTYGSIYSTGFVHYFAKAHWKLDYSHYVSDWTKTQKQTVNSISAAIGFDW